MGYNLNWNSNHPGHVVYLIDLSGSMGEMRGNRRLVDVVMEAVGSLFTNLSSKLDSNGETLEYMTASVYGYNDEVIELFRDDTADSFVTFVDSAIRKGFLFDTSESGPAFPQWRTFMADAYDKASEDILEWIGAQRAKGITRIPAPIVINITDGFPYEGENVNAYEKARKAAEYLKSICVEDGNVLLFNIHYTVDSEGAHLVLPSQPPKDKSLRFMYDVSSVIPEKLIESAKIEFDEPGITKESRTMISNETDPRKLLRFITWGTSTGGVVKSGIKLPGIELEKPR